MPATTVFSSVGVAILPFFDVNGNFNHMQLIGEDFFKDKTMHANRNVTDKVGPHRDLLWEFPYLEPPHH
jgi:hypothetical protein